MKEFVNKQYLDEGQYGKCYTIDRDKVLKIFKEVHSLDEVEKFKYFKKYSNESFLFPFEFIYDEKGFHGYITKKALGKKLSKVFKLTPLIQLSNSSIKLQENIDYISKGKILMYDFHDENIIYDGNNFQVIDPDSYDVDNSYSIDEIQKTNSRFHRELITDIFISPYLKTRKYDRYVLDKLKSYRYSKNKVSEIILQAKEDFENYYKEQINTISDIDNVLKR